MVKLVCMALLASLGVCGYLVIHRSFEAPTTLGPPELHRPGVTFGGIYRRELGDNPPTLDPTLVTDIYGGAVVRQLFDGLVQFDAHLRPIPAIAEFWGASQDRLTWTFTFRRGVRFHHRREVTAQDVVYSFTRLLSLNRPVTATAVFRHIQGATAFMQGKTTSVQGLAALDRYTLQIMLEEPLASFVAALGLPNTAVVPQEEVEKPGDGFGRAPVGTGPFTFVRWEPNQEIVLEANDQYYEGRPFLDELVFKILVGGMLEERIAEFLQGHLEEAIIPSGKLDEVRADPKYRHYQRVRIPTLSLLYVGFNTQMKPFDDRRVRQAFNYAVNKEAIVREITQSGRRLYPSVSLTATGVLPPGMLGYDPELQGYAYDPAKAKRLLAEAGYPGAGFPVVQLWSVHQAETTKAELAAYQKYLAHFGVKLEIHYASDWPAYKAMMEQGKLPMFRLVRFADTPDPDNFLAPMLHSTGSSNYTFYRNPLVDQLLEQARREFDEAQRIALYHEVERLVMDDAPWIAQHYGASEYFYQPYVQGVEINWLGPHAIPMKKIWLKKSLAEGSTAAMTDVQARRLALPDVGPHGRCQESTSSPTAHHSMAGRSISVGRECFWPWVLASIHTPGGWPLALFSRGTRSRFTGLGRSA